MIIRNEFQQGSAEWYQARLGIPTASNFDKIITPAKGDLSKSSRSYAFYLVAETLLGAPLESLDHLEWVARGKEMEPMAVRTYQVMQDLTDAEVRPVGFITVNDGTVGASPDRLLPAHGGLEVKCPAPQTHIGYLIDGPGDAYRPQVQGQMWVAELEYVDFFSFHPAMPPVLHKVFRDEPYIAKIRAAMDQFTEMRLRILETAKATGYFEARKQAMPPVDQAAEQWGNHGASAFEGIPQPG